MPTKGHTPLTKLGAKLTQVQTMLGEAQIMLDDLNSRGKTGDPFRAKLASDITAYLKSTGQPYTTKQLAYAIAGALDRSPHTLQQSHLPSLAEIGFPHCYRVGRRVLWRYRSDKDKASLTDKILRIRRKEKTP